MSSPNGTAIGDIFINLIVTLKDLRKSPYGGTAYCDFAKVVLEGSGKAGEDFFGKLYMLDLKSKGVVTKIFLGEDFPARKAAKLDPLKFTCMHAIRDRNLRIRALHFKSHKKPRLRIAETTPSKAPSKIRQHPRRHLRSAKTPQSCAQLFNDFYMQ